MLIMLITGLICCSIAISAVALQGETPQHVMAQGRRFIEFLMLAVAFGLTIDLWSKCVGILFVIGDNESWFWDLGRYFAGGAGLLLAALVSFVFARRTTRQWVLNLAGGMVIVTFYLGMYGEQFWPRWEGGTADTAAVALAQRSFVIKPHRIINAPYAVNHRYSPGDRIYLAVTPTAVLGRVAVRPYLPGYWISKGTDHFPDAAEAYDQLFPAAKAFDYGLMAKVDDVAASQECLKLVMEKYPGTPEANAAAEWYRKLAALPPGTRQTTVGQPRPLR